MKQTINEIEVNGTIYVPKEKQTEGLTCVLIRSYAAGVHFGYLEKESFTPSGKVVTLSKSRRIWYWSGAATLSQIANEGVKDANNSKFSQVVDSIEIVNVIETIPLTKDAIENLYKVWVWKQ